MIKIIIGQNASGKTLYLDNVVEEMSRYVECYTDAG